ncbi:MAG: hypothetical protein GX974_01850 [Clostridiales bacterium]|nr:hypothetical protein [Clostridiales bacterium]
MHKETKDRNLENETIIKHGLKTKRLGQNIFYLHSVESTNTFAKNLAREGAIEGTTIIADEQIGGRGRLGRSWISPKMKGV